ncbi:hypothetical protein ACFVHW_07110 [Streptomyces sp. NPDC127110]|uniref:hypothetical protein n=1 Tax=Streptomyces sp. NPDC127110 TaxID=3345362 RepID=UPI003627D98D
MGRFQMSRAVIARLGVLLGGLLFVVGILLAIDLAAALMTAGVLTVTYCLLVADVDPPGRSERGSP